MDSGRFLNMLLFVTTLANQRSPRKLLFENHSQEKPKVLTKISLSEIIGLKINPGVVNFLNACCGVFYISLFNGHESMHFDQFLDFRFHGSI